jgi:hypothetical protein
MAFAKGVMRQRFIFGTNDAVVALDSRRRCHLLRAFA